MQSYVGIISAPRAARDTSESPHKDLALSLTVRRVVHASQCTSLSRIYFALSLKPKVSPLCMNRSRIYNTKKAAKRERADFFSQKTTDLIRLIFPTRCRLYYTRACVNCAELVTATVSIWVIFSPSTRPR